MTGKTGDDGRFYDIHGAVSIKILGRDPVSEIIHRTLCSFEVASGHSDLTLVLGSYPGPEWEPEGTLVGDRFLYQPETDTTTVLGSRVEGKPSKPDVEYVITGDLRAPGKQVSAFVPRLRRPWGSGKSFWYDLRHNRPRRAILGFAGNPFGLREVVRQAERVTESIIEPFLYYRLPEKGLCLTHAASVGMGDGASLLAGSANVGKTTFALRSVKEKMAFLGDSMVVVSETGDVLAYPGLVKLHRRHLSFFPELVDRLAASARPLEARLLRGELLAKSRQAIDLLPQRLMTELFDNVVIPQRKRLQMGVQVVRGSFARIGTSSVSPEELAKSLAADLCWAFEAAPWRDAQYVAASSAYSGSDLVQESAAHHRKVDDVLQKATSNAQCYRLSLPFDAPIPGVAGILPQSEGV